MAFSARLNAKVLSQNVGRQGQRGAKENGEGIIVRAFAAKKGSRGSPFRHL